MGAFHFQIILSSNHQILSMKLDILFFGAHPDDVELGCAGTILKHVALEYKVGIVDLTKGELGTRGTVEIRAKEAKEAAKLMGVFVRENLAFADGFFVNDKQHQLAIIKLIRKYQPNIIVATAITDRHPDHARASQLISDSCFLAGLSKIKTTSQKAFRPKAVYHYIQDRYIKPDFVVDISDVMKKKIEVIKTYQSQFFNPESKEAVTYISTAQFLDAIAFRAAEFGRIIGASYGEGFTAERLVGVSNLFDLK